MDNPLLSLRPANRAVRDARHAGASPNNSPVSNERATVKPKTHASTPADAMRVAAAAPKKLCGKFDAADATSG
jgi:hypothetical protein